MISVTKVEKEAILRNLSDVGFSKSIGYLPLQTVEKFLRMDVDDLARLMRSKGLAARILSVDECCINSGAIYVYNTAALQKLLDENVEVLEASSWPSAADQFVSHVAKSWLEPDHAVFAVIQRAFGEEVLPARGVQHGI